MNYCVLNGVKSNTVKGLLIQSLPPISKPAIRTQVEEIDGRDGDIVTKLGYSAYNKQMTIGLHGDYNVDDVIRFFDSSGTVVFSNEPDKYYRYEIIQQIDFARLIRFRTATVTFHVQPFKYAAVDRKYTFTNDFLYMANHTKTENGVTVTAADDQITLSGTATKNTAFYVPIKRQLLAAGEYTLTINHDGTGSCTVRLVKDSASDYNSFGGQYVSLSSDSTASVIATIENKTEYGYVWVRVKKGTKLDSTLYLSLQNNEFESVTIRNIGNTTARPIITIHALQGVVNLFLNDQQLFIINFPQFDYITIDAEQMNAYAHSTLVNRLVQGNYDNLVLKQGNNTISWTGGVKQIEIENFSRWI